MRQRDAHAQTAFAISCMLEPVTPRTVNLELAYFRAMFNELRRLDELTAPNPLENVREFKISES